MNEFEDPTETILNKYPWTAMTKNIVAINERLNTLNFNKEKYIDSQFSDELRSATSKNNHRLVKT